MNRPMSAAGRVAIAGVLLKFIFHLCGSAPALDHLIDAATLLMIERLAQEPTDSDEL